MCQSMDKQHALTITTVHCIMRDPREESIYSGVNPGISWLCASLAPGHHSCDIEELLFFKLVFSLTRDKCAP